MCIIFDKYIHTHVHMSDHILQLTRHLVDYSLKEKQIGGDYSL